MGDGMSTRAVFHMVLAETLIALLLLKVLVVRFFKGFVKNAPALGMALFVLTLVVFLITAGLSSYSSPPRRKLAGPGSLDPLEIALRAHGQHEFLPAAVGDEPVVGLQELLDRFHRDRARSPA
ncbi:MAG: hypothetical protein M0C28_02750 [Candidatus Moduliflexus flocculans]|nr:hypothetical protein [Candidatus Moduliflexus flocculans]